MTVVDSTLPLLMSIALKFHSIFAKYFTIEHGSGKAIWNHPNGFPWQSNLCVSPCRLKCVSFINNNMNFKVGTSSFRSGRGIIKLSSLRNPDKVERFIFLPFQVGVEFPSGNFPNTLYTFVLCSYLKSLWDWEPSKLLEAKFWFHFLFKKKKKENAFFTQRV